MLPIFLRAITKNKIKQRNYTYEKEFSHYQNNGWHPGGIDDRSHCCNRYYLFPSLKIKESPAFGAGDSFLM